MGLQYWTCPANGLFTLGLFQIVGYLRQRKLLIEDVLGDFFIDPDTEAGWANIQRIIEPHGLSKVMLTGASPSKPIRQGDGMFNPFMLQKQHANICMMYETAESLGNIKDPDDEYLRMWWNIQDMPIQNQESTMRWNAILAAYEVIHEIEATTALVVESIKPLYYSNASYSKTPMQVQFFAGDMMHGALMKPDALCDVPWTTVDQFKTDNLLTPGIIDIMFNLSLEKLWYIDIPTIAFSGGGKSIPDCNPGTTFVLADDDDCFDKSGSFSPDPPTPPGTDTQVSGTVTGDSFEASMWKTSIIAGDDPVITGTVSVSYKRLIVT